MRTGYPSLLLGCSLLLALARAHAAPDALPDYVSFQLQARGGGGVAPAQFNLSSGAVIDNASVDLNNAGRVAARVRVSTGQPGDASNRHVFVGDNGVGFDVSEGPVGSSISAPRVAPDGKVWFAANLAGGGALAGIYRYDPATLATVRITGLPSAASAYAGARGNAAGQVGYLAEFASGKAWVSFAGAVAEIHLEDRSRDPASAYSLLLPPSFDETRLMAGKVVLFSGGHEQIVAKDNRIGDPVILAQTVGQVPASPFVAFDDEVAMSPNGGRVAFVAELAGGIRGVFRSDSPGNIVEIARSGDPGLSAIEFVAPAVNDDGLVAFRGVDGSGKESIFVADDTDLRRVIGRGDPVATDLGPGRIEQSNVNDVALLGGVAINAGGDIAFAAALAPVANNQIEWGNGIYIARVGTDALHADGFENP
jgi:hypothetical protein